ncbi:MAG: response regulator [Pleurocapsa sp. MO_226.B13]|nr:response regulator [Pleurocapsa sp. MO_226.B13]
MDYHESVIKTDLKNRAIPLILVLEDDEDNELLLRYSLAMFGWTSLIATDAITAINLAKEKQPDLILLDIVLPNISGLQIASILKRHDRTRHIPLIAVTGLAREEEQDLIFAVGFDDYICKPYQLESLYRAIASCLEIAAVEKQQVSNLKVSN